MSKLRSIHIIIIGVVVSVILAVGMFFLLIKPATEARDVQKKTYDDTYAAGGNEQAKKAAEDDLVLANQEVATARAKLDVYMQAEQPDGKCLRRGRCGENIAGH